MVEVVAEPVEEAVAMVEEAAVPVSLVKGQMVIPEPFRPSTVMGDLVPKEFLQIWAVVAETVVRRAQVTISAGAVLMEQLG